jgi:hypothetical protein
MGTIRAHITLPEDLINELDRVVEKRQRSQFVAEAVRKELLLTRQKRALRLAAGSWKDKDHPDLKAGSLAWVRRMRRESEERFQRQFRRR